MFKNEICSSYCGSNKLNTVNNCYIVRKHRPNHGRLLEPPIIMKTPILTHNVSSLLCARTQPASNLGFGNKV